MSLLLLQGLVAFLATYGLLVLLVSFRQALLAWRRSRRPPLVSLLLLLRDKEAVVEGLVLDLLALDYGAAGEAPNLELVAVDDRSRDTTPLLLDKLAQKHAALRLLRLPAAAPPAESAVDVGLFLCRSPVVLVLDARGGVQPALLLGAAEYLLGRRRRAGGASAVSW